MGGRSGAAAVGSRARRRTGPRSACLRRRAGIWWGATISLAPAPRRGVRAQAAAVAHIGIPVVSPSPTLNELYRSFSAGNTFTRSEFRRWMHETMFGAEVGADWTGETS